MKFSSSDIRSGVAAATCCFIYGIVASAPGLSSLLFVASMTKFNINRKQASFPFFLCYTSRNVLGPMIGFLGNKFGLKRVILLGCLISSLVIGACCFSESILTITIFWGVGFGFGFGMAVVLLPQILSFHFSKHLDKAIGINIGGECIAAFLMTLLTDYLLRNYGLSGTFLILSGVISHSLPAAMLIDIPKKVENINPIPEKLVENVNPHAYKETLPSTQQLELESTQNPYDGPKMVITSVPAKERVGRKSSISAFKVFLDPTFILILITQSALMYIVTTNILILFDISIDRGVSESKAVYILIGFKAADAVGRFTLGSVTDYGCLSKANFLGFSFAAIGLLLVSFLWVKGFTAMMAFVLVTGIFYGGLMMISPSIVMHYIDKDYHSMALSSRFLFYAPLSFTQAPLIGYFRDTLRSYDGLIYILVGICCVNSVISFLIPPFVRFRDRRKENLQDRREGMS